MSNAETDRQDRPRIVEDVLSRTTSRERALGLACLSVGLVGGMWIGLFMVPAEALSPLVTESQPTPDGMEYSKHFHPVPWHMPLTSLIVLVVGLYAARLQVLDRNQPDESEGGSDE